MKKSLISQFYFKNRFFFVCGVLVSIATALLNLMFSWIMQQLVDTASGVTGSRNVKTLAILCCGIFVYGFAVYMLEYAVRPRFIRSALIRYRDYAFKMLTRKSISSFYREDASSYLSALTNDVSIIENDYILNIFSIILQIVSFAGALTMMLLYSPLLTGIALILTAIPFAASLITGGKMGEVTKRVSDKSADFTSTLTDCLAGFAVIKSFKAELEIIKLFSKSNKNLENEKFSKRRLELIIQMIGSGTGLIAQLGVFFAGALIALRTGRLSPGTIIVFIQLMNFVISPVSQLPNLLTKRKAGSALIEKLAGILEKNTECTDDGPAHNLTPVKKEIQIQNVTFGYDENTNVLNNISLKFEAGKAYAIVGASGSGKSTLLNLLTRTREDGYEGNIFFDDLNLRDITPESLYENISVISQNVFVFNASIRDNITMFREFPDSEVESAINRAHLNDLVSERGEDCMCGENGRELSGGEKQRISIARSLLKKSSVLLADEVTASLDARTAHQVSSDILDLKGMTRIVVTHSLDAGLLKRYDEILVLKDGAVKEQGRFDELIERKGYFYALYTVAQ
ncbi:MAG: ABC transporter ATP-binding protein [Lachnospiraceae bacterium]|nr:ABC transporter ATP-binding protein [Lachnospiraceae bacterium]